MVVIILIIPSCRRRCITNWWTILHEFHSATATSTFAGGDYAHTYVSSDEKTIKVGGDYAHTFVCRHLPDCMYKSVGGTTTPTGADYTPSTGSLILTVNNHGLDYQDLVNIQ